MINKNDTAVTSGTATVRLYRIKWIDTKTGKTGNGNWSSDKNLLKAWVENGNKQFPYIKHELEEKP